MNSNLYPDFKLTLDNCSEEPIHRPVATQGHGHILVFDPKRPRRLYAMNEHFPEWLGKSAATIWEQSVEHWLPGTLQGALQTLQLSEENQPMDTVSLCHNAQAFDVIQHLYSGKAFIELEQSSEKPAEFRDVERVLNRLRGCLSLDELFEVASQHVRKTLRYDRVMIYQFDKDFHGNVIGEAKEPHLEPFLGLHYPATDIPVMSRDLLLKNRSRSISDIQLPNQRLLFNPDLGLSIPHLDLTMCQLRATSPVHIEYLEHMGVRATLTLAIVQEGKLWGLFACHHYAPRTLTFEMRKMAETISDLFSVRLSELQREQRKYYFENALEAEQGFLNEIRVEDHYKLELVENGENLMRLCRSDGAAIVSMDGVISAIGIVPSSAEIMALRDWLMHLENNELFATDNMMTTVPIAAGFSCRIGGMIAASVSEVTKNYLFWFRVPCNQITNWAGDPSKTLESMANADNDEIRLSPRKSFAKWQVAVENRSLPWDPDEIAAINRIRNKILKLEFQRTAATVIRSRQEFMQLIYAASHDLQEPLRTQLNYMELLSEEMHETTHQEWFRFVGRATNAVYRMQALIADLLDYASLGMQTKREPIDLQSLIAEIQEDLSQAVNKKHAVVHVGSLPWFKGNRNELKQLFQNLLTNAIKYVAIDVIPQIQISARREGRFVLFTIKDNGIGIAEEHFQKIFLMFQRLHGREQYQGTGIGLALCKKIVENYGGFIGLTSTLGKGSTFWMRFHEFNILGDLK